jgi:hypothetical protein
LKLIGVVRDQNMEPPSWNNPDPNPGARPQTRAFRGDKGLDVANQNRASGGGRKMFLTCPYIDQRFHSQPSHAVYLEQIERRTLNEQLEL